MLHAPVFYRLISADYCWPYSTFLQVSVFYLYRDVEIRKRKIINLRKKAFAVVRSAVQTKLLQVCHNSMLRKKPVGSVGQPWETLREEIDHSPDCRPKNGQRNGLGTRWKWIEYTYTRCFWDISAKTWTLYVKYTHDLSINLSYIKSLFLHSCLDLLSH